MKGETQKLKSMLYVRVIVGCEGLGVKAEAEMNGMEVQSVND